MTIIFILLGVICVIIAITAGNLALASLFSEETGVTGCFVLLLVGAFFFFDSNSISEMQWNVTNGSQY